MECDMKSAGGAIVRYVNKPKFVWKISERRGYFSTSLSRVGEQIEEDNGKGDKETGG